ncbi:hypothetical protein FOA52_003159 [Chlamydomonas sp. UWO 241]|nr:hypothetical protein FOA52_003159 [Chlamydomonas sp. UWO 241]
MTIAFVAVLQELQAVAGAVEAHAIFASDVGSVQAVQQMARDEAIAAHDHRFATAISRVGDAEWDEEGDPMEAPVSALPGFTCEEFQALPPHLRSAEDAALLHLSATQRWKKCPSCCQMVERVSGCNQMSCRCGSSFCYSCGLKYRSNAPTANNAHGTPACSCELFAVPDEDAPGASAAAAPQPGHLLHGLVPAVARANIRAAPARQPPRHGDIDEDGRLCRGGRRVSKMPCRNSCSIHGCRHGPGKCWFRHIEDADFF